MTRSVALALLALGASMVTSIGEAKADGPAKTARVEVDAPSDCVNEATFWKALARRTDRVVQAEKQAPTARIEVSIKKDARVVGEITISERGTRSERRRIAGATCEEVTMGLSLVAALAFDPAARVDVGPEPKPAELKPEPTAPEKTAARNELASPVTAATSPPEPVQSARIAPAAAERAGGSPPPPESIWHWGVGALGGVAAMGTSSPLVSYGGFVDLAISRPPLGYREDTQEAVYSLFKPSFRVGGRHARGFADGGLASADLAWTVGFASMCPFRFDLARPVALRPCAGLDVGVISATATNIEKTTDRTRFWLAPNAVMRLTWSPNRRFFAEIQGGASLPLVRDEFAVDPTVSVYRAPILAPIGEIAAGAHFQ